MWTRYQELVNKSKKAQGLPVKEIPKTIYTTEKDIQKLTLKRETAVIAKKERQVIVDIDKRLKPLEMHHRKLVDEYVKGDKP